MTINEISRHTVWRMWIRYGCRINFKHNTIQQLKWNTSNLIKRRKCALRGGLKWLLNWNSGPFTFRIGISITNAVVRNYQLAFDWFQLINNFTQNNTQIHSKNTKFAAVVSQLDCGGLPTGFEEYRHNLRFAVVVTRSIEENLICAVWIIHFTEISQN